MMAETEWVHPDMGGFVDSPPDRKGQERSHKARRRVKLTVGIPAVSDTKDENGLGRIVDFENNAIVAYADAPQICAAGELGNARRSWVAFKSKQNVGQPEANIGRKFCEVAVRGRPEQNRVGHQAVLPGLPTTARSGCDDPGSALASSASR